MDQLDPTIVRRLVEGENMTLREAAEYLKQLYPAVTRGLSVASLERFCADHNIHRIPPINAASRQMVNDAVQEAVKQVNFRF